MGFIIVILLIYKGGIVMKKLLVKGLIILGILGIAAVSTNYDDSAIYPPQHSPKLIDDGGYTINIYPPQH